MAVKWEFGRNYQQFVTCKPHLAHRSWRRTLTSQPAQLTQCPLSQCFLYAFIHNIGIKRTIC